MTDTTPRFTALDTSLAPVRAAGPRHSITRDAQTGLEWTGAALGRLNHADAMKAANELDIAGGGWRPPTRAELVGITDITRRNPAIDAEAFPFVKPAWYWSSDGLAADPDGDEDDAAWSSAFAWYVLFDHGYVGLSHRDDVGFALAVRRAGQ